MLKIVRVSSVSEGKRLTPAQDLEKIKKAITDLDFRLESTGNMTTDIWNCLYDAQNAVEKAIALLNSYRDA